MTSIFYGYLILYQALLYEFTNRRFFSYVGQRYMNRYGSKQQGIWPLLSPFYSKLSAAKNSVFS